MQKIEFSKWYHWYDRNSIKNIHLEGVYLLARFKNNIPQGEATPLSNEIIYIGETCRSLKQRWKEFDNSAFHEKAGHSGGWSYAREYNNLGEDLYVSACPITHKFDNIAQKNNYIRYIERKLIWELSKKYPNKELLNKK